MGAAVGTRVPVVQGLDFNAPRVRATTTIAPSTKANVNDILGLTNSRYEGMKSVGDSGYYLKNGKLYEAYTPAPANPGYMYGISGGPLYNQNSGPSLAEGSIKVGEQNFKPAKNVSVPGFVENDDGTYEISQAYLSANKPKYEGTPQQNIMPFLSLASIPQEQIDPTRSAGVARFLSQDSLDSLMKADSENTTTAQASQGGGK